MRTYSTNKTTQYNNPNKHQTRFYIFSKQTPHRNQTYLAARCVDCVLLKVAAVWMIGWIKNQPAMRAPKKIKWCTANVVRSGWMATGFYVEMVVWRLMRWRRGYSDQMTELVCWSRSPMEVVRSLFRDGSDAAGGYCVGLQASEITRDLCFIAQDSVETLQHRFSWGLW